MTRRKERIASERKSGIGENERQPKMAQLATRWKRFNLVILVTFKQGNHPDEGYVRRA